jgi:hypothetical protein
MSDTPDGSHLDGLDGDLWDDPADPWSPASDPSGENIFGDDEEFDEPDDLPPPEPRQRWTPPPPPSRTAPKFAATLRKPGGGVLLPLESRAVRRWLIYAASVAAGVAIAGLVLGQLTHSGRTPLASGASRHRASQPAQGHVLGSPPRLRVASPGTTNTRSQTPPASGRSATSSRHTPRRHAPHRTHVHRQRQAPSTGTARRRTSSHKRRASRRSRQPVQTAPRTTPAVVNQDPTATTSEGAPARYPSSTRRRAAAPVQQASSTGGSEFSFEQ